MIITIVRSMKVLEKYKIVKEKLEKRSHKLILPEPDEFYSEEKNIKLKAMQNFNKNLKKSDSILVANYSKDNRQY